MNDKHFKLEAQIIALVVLVLVFWIVGFHRDYKAARLTADGLHYARQSVALLNELQANHEMTFHPQEGRIIALERRAWPKTSMTLSTQITDDAAKAIPIMLDTLEALERRIAALEKTTEPLVTKTRTVVYTRNSESGEWDQTAVTEPPGIFSTEPLPTTGSVEPTERLPTKMPSTAQWDVSIEEPLQDFLYIQFRDFKMTVPKQAVIQNADGTTTIVAVCCPNCTRWGVPQSEGLYHCRWCDKVSLVKP